MSKYGHAFLLLILIVQIITLVSFAPGFGKTPSVNENSASPSIATTNEIREGLHNIRSQLEALTAANNNTHSESVAINDHPPAILPDQ